MQDICVEIISKGDFKKAKSILINNNQPTCDWLFDWYLKSGAINGIDIFYLQYHIVDENWFLSKDKGCLILIPINQLESNLI